MTFNQFQQQVFAALHAIVSDAELHPLTAPNPAQNDLTALINDVQGVAEEMALCGTLDSAMSTLRANPAVLLGTVWLTTNISDSDGAIALRRAYASTDSSPTVLPGFPVAAYLIELCDSLKRLERPDTKSGPEPHSK